MAARGKDKGVVKEFPDVQAGDGLTVRQRRVLEVIRDSVERRGYPPSMREIGDAVGLSSTSSVSHQLAMLQRKGFLRRDLNRPRAVDLRTPEEVLAARSTTPAPKRPRHTTRPVSLMLRRRRPTCRWWAASPPADRFSPSSPWRRCSRYPASSSVRGRCSC
ncbi:MAG: hypothetical protein WKF47_08305 [Geodermatophilaceae bacterium]